MATRFRGYLPVVVDVETAGFNAKTDALLEIAAIPIVMDKEGVVHPGETCSRHIIPFSGANLDESALAFNGIDPYHPFRFAVDEKKGMLDIFQPIRKAVKASGCTRAILVGHNPSFDLGFLNAAIKRCHIKRNPFHPFSTFDTATLGGLACGQTVLARAVQAAKLSWDESQAHSAIYDTERTAALFCAIVNRWRDFNLSSVK
ncbi:MAG: ribonuclease T [Gammaproteobacteria bacterium]|nr:ribonuclease T [Gammaproteobacteria bacterium]